MKKLFLESIVLTTLFAALCSCSGGGDAIESTPLKVSETSIKTTVLGETKTLTLQSPGAWYATTTAKDLSTGKNWVSITPSYGDKGGTFEVKLKIAKNNSSDSRDGNIIFKTQDGSQQIDVKISQNWSRVITLPCTEYTMGWDGATIFIAGLSETGVSAVIPEQEKWVEFQQPNSIIVGQNNGTSLRYTNIKFIDSTAGKEYVIALIQEGMGENASFLPLSELKIDDYKCPSDSRTDEPDFYYAVDMNSSESTKTAKITFRGEGVEWITIGDSDTKVYSGDTFTFENIKAGKNIIIKTHNSSINKAGENLLYVSGLPLVEITTSGTIKDEPKVDCVVKIFDPEARTDDGDNKNLKYFESLAGIEYRGAGAQRYAKKPYNFKLKDSAGEKREAELLNIRNDNSWILDGMYLDIAHMRNRVCFDLWNSFNKPYYVSEKPKAMSGTRGHYVEVFINGEYMGLFILSDRIDRKQYQIDQHSSKDANDGGYIYKAKGWTSACLMKGYSKRSSNDDYYWSVEIEQEYPGEDDGKPNFNPMADIIDFVAKTSPEEFSARFEEVFDVSSIVDAFIFLNMIVADDNIGRNTFWIIRNIKTAPKVMHGVWDLDGSLGRNWDRHTEPAKQDQSPYMKGWVIGHGNNGSGTRFYFHERIINENPANIHQKIYDRWQELKNGALSPTSFNDIVDYYARIQKGSGVIDREVARWKAIDVNAQPQWNYAAVYYGDLDNETNYMKSWYKERHSVLDGLISSLNHK